ALPKITKRNRSLVLSQEIAAQRFGYTIFWAVAGMILIASTAVCATVILRSRSEASISSFQYSRMVSEVDLLRRRNASLETETAELNSDARLIESEARARLGMVRPNEIVVVDDRTKVDTGSRLISFVH